MIFPQRLLIFGASARAAAFSARRAGLEPWCADLFADADLQACCPVRRIPSRRYPQELLRVSRSAPAGTWMYTGALENRPTLVQQLAGTRLLLGNDAPVLRRVRSPETWSALLREAGFAVPEIRLPSEELPARGRWLVKKRRSAGGVGIRFWTGESLAGRASFLQKWVEGEDHAAVFVGAGQQARLLGVTRQLVGESWLNACPFAYGGSIGPLPLPPSLRRSLEQLGETLVRGFGLRGLFGVDFLLKDGIPWPVEINPRDTASVEVLEHGRGEAALALHVQAFAPVLLPASRGREPPEMVAKAILFAQAPLRFPADGPWKPDLEKHRDASPWRLPAFADIPPAGQLIEAGHPILTFFARGSTVRACRNALQEIARALAGFLWKM